MSVPQQVVFEPLYPDVVAPVRATQGSAGYDVCAHVRGRTLATVMGLESGSLQVADRLVLEPRIRVAVPLGFRARLPVGLEAQIRLRSSTAFRRGLIMPNAPATIDADYPGEWMVLLTNTAEEPVEIGHLERIAQIVFSRVETVEWNSGRVSISTDRSGGLGSTGQ